MPKYRVYLDFIRTVECVLDAVDEIAATHAALEIVTDAIENENDDSFDRLSLDNASAYEIDDNEKDGVFL